MTGDRNERSSDAVLATLLGQVTQIAADVSRQTTDIAVLKNDVSRRVDQVEKEQEIHRGKIDELVASENKRKGAIWFAGGAGGVLATVASIVWHKVSGGP